MSNAGGMVMTANSATIERRIEQLRSSDNLKQLKRRLRFFRRVGLLNASRDDVSIERAVTRDDLEGAYTLVHEAFHERGFIPPQTGGLRVRAYEALPEMATFVAKLNGRIVAAMSLLPDSPDMGLPADHAFGEELNALRAEGRYICEITNDAVVKEHRTGGFFMQLTRACFAHAVAIGCDDVFACINPEHVSFFENVLRFEPCGEQRSYSGAPEDLVEGKRLDLDDLEELAVEFDQLLGEQAFLRDFYFTGNPYTRKVEAWSAKAEAMFSDPAFLKELFVHRSGLLVRCNEQELEAIRRRWGDEAFAEVWGAREKAEFAGKPEWRSSAPVQTVQSDS